MFLKATLVTRSSFPPGGGGTRDKFVRETTRNGKTSDLGRHRPQTPKKLGSSARIENSDPRKTQTPRVFQNLRAPKNSVRDFMALNNLCLFSCQQLREYRNLESLCTRNEIFTIFCGCVLRDASHGAVTRFSVKHYCTYGYQNVMRQ